MNPGGRGQFDGDSPLDAYLDGRLAGPERSAFEARLAGDPALKADVEIQRRLDRSLRSMFVVPPIVGLPTNGDPKLPDAKATPPASTLPSQKLLLGVLTTLIVGIGAWLVATFFVDPRMSFSEVYRQQVQAAATAPKSSPVMSLGCGLTMKQSDPGIQIVAASMSPVISRNTVVYRAMIDGKHVVLFADAALRDDGRAERKSKLENGMHLFRRNLGNVVVYEMTPLDKPRLLDQLDLAPVACEASTQPAD